jgi:hypothetical protein
LQQSEIEQIEKSERVGGAQQHKRITALLNKQIKDTKAKLAEVLTFISCLLIICFSLSHAYCMYMIHDMLCSTLHTNTHKR